MAAWTSAGPATEGLEDENLRLKELLADSRSVNAALEDLLGKMVVPAAERNTVSPLQTAYGMSEAQPSVEEKR